MHLYEKVLEETEGLEKVKKVVVSLSGGLDSTTLLYLMVKEFGARNVFALSFNYNQRHDIELQLAKRTTEKLGVYHKVVDLSFLGEVTSNVSAMVKGSVKTPTMEDLASQKTVPTYVPFRNTILSGLTFAFAESVGADGIALGVQYGDYEHNDVYHYWDCTDKFQAAMQAVADLNDKHKLTFIAPFIHLTKQDEIKVGQELGVPYEDTWTCYNPFVETQLETEGRKGKTKTVTKNHYTPCGTCPSCVGRIEAFKKLGIEDPGIKGVSA